MQESWLDKFWRWSVRLMCSHRHLFKGRAQGSPTVCQDCGKIWL
jgi:hypothetical protein